MILILVSRRSFYFGPTATAEKDSLYSINQRGFLQKAVYIGLMERPTRPENAFATSIDR